MAKSTRPDRKRSDRRSREPKEFEETTLSIDRVTRVVKGGRRLRFRAVVVVGDKKGKVGMGTGKATEVQAAVQKAIKSAKREMIKVPMVNGTIPHEVDTKFKAARIRLLPAREGTGIIAGGALRVILEHAGVKDVLSKRYGTGNKLVNAQAVMIALKSLRTSGADAAAAAEEEAKKAEKKASDSEEDGEMPEGLQVKEVSREEIEKKD